VRTINDPQQVADRLGLVPGPRVTVRGEEFLEGCA